MRASGWGKLYNTRIHSASCPNSCNVDATGVDLPQARQMSFCIQSQDSGFKNFKKIARHLN